MRRKYSSVSWVACGAVACAAVFVFGVGGQASVWPVRYEEADVGELVSTTDNPYVVAPLVLRLEITGTDSGEVNLASSEVAQLCGDGDGCHAQLLLFPNAAPIALEIAYGRLFTSGTGPFLWKILRLDGGGEKQGDTGDEVDDFVMFLSAPGGGSGTRSCVFGEDPGRSGSFEFAIAHGGLGPHSCVLRIDD